jgi:DNA-binding SARP family transcriptional activator
MFRQDTYLLHPDLAIEQDVDRFQQAYASGERALAEHDVDAAREAFEQARASYGGEFLSDSPYEDWAAEQRAALQDMHLDVLAQLARVYAAAADWDRASGCCRELLAADPYREDACRDLMRCEAARGRRAEVRDVFETCERRLRRDLQVAPAAETRRLYRALLSGDSDP